MIAVAGGLAVAAAVQAAVMPWTTKAVRRQASTSTSPAVVEDILKFTFEYTNHPTSITLGINYVAPANTNEALYDSGDGVWRSFTSRAIPVLASSNYVAFKGDWRRSSGTYLSMFQVALITTNARCRISGRFAYAPTNNANAYRETFNGCTQITSVDDNPFPFLTGTPGASMFYRTFLNCARLTNIADGTLNLSDLTGEPASNMLSGTFQGCSNILAGNFNISSNITFADTNITSSMSSAFAGMTKWTGTVYWGSSRIYEAITNPASDANTFQNSTNVPGYTTMGANWK
jgi:hypothetical protein